MTARLTLIASALARALATSPASAEPSRDESSAGAGEAAAAEGNPIPWPATHTNLELAQEALSHGYYDSAGEMFLSMLKDLESNYLSAWSSFFGKAEGQAQILHNKLPFYGKVVDGLAAVYWETGRDRQLTVLLDTRIPNSMRSPWYCRLLERRGHHLESEQCWSASERTRMRKPDPPEDKDLSVREKREFRENADPIPVTVRGDTARELRARRAHAVDSTLVPEGYAIGYPRPPLTLPGQEDTGAESDGAD